MSAFGAVGLSDHFENVVTCGHKRIERRDGEIGRAEEDQFHEGRR